MWQLGSINIGPDQNPVPVFRLSNRWIYIFLALYQVFDERNIGVGLLWFKVKLPCLPIRGGRGHAEMLVWCGDRLMNLINSFHSFGKTCKS